MSSCFPKLLRRLGKRQALTRECRYRFTVRSQTFQLGNLLCVRRDGDGNYTLHANGTELDQSTLFKETSWMRTDGSQDRVLCYLKWTSQEENIDYKLAVEDGQLKLVKEVESSKSQKFRMVFDKSQHVALKSVQTKEYISCDEKTNKVILSKEFDKQVLFERIQVS